MGGAGINDRKVGINRGLGTTPAVQGASDEKKVSYVRILFLKPAGQSAKILCSSVDGNHA